MMSWDGESRKKKVFIQRITTRRRKMTFCMHWFLYLHDATINFYLVLCHFGLDSFIFFFLLNHSKWLLRDEGLNTRDAIFHAFTHFQTDLLLIFFFFFFLCLLLLKHHNGYKRFQENKRLTIAHYHFWCIFSNFQMQYKYYLHIKQTHLFRFGFVRCISLDFFSRSRQKEFRFFKWKVIFPHSLYAFKWKQWKLKTKLSHKRRSTVFNQWG